MPVINNTDLEKHSGNSEKTIAEENNANVEKSGKRNYNEDMDTGYAWVVVVGCFLVDFVINGFTLSFGVFLNHYVENDFKGKLDTYSGSWIGTLAKFLRFIMGIGAGPLADKIGYKATLSIGATLLCLGQLLSSFSTEVWHLFLSQGVLVGIGSSLAYYPAISAPTYWFDQKKGLALGICVAGSGIGGFVWSPMVQALLSKLGFRWCLRVCCLITAVCMAIATLLVRIKPKSASNPKKSVDLDFIKDPKFLSIISTGFIAQFGYLAPFYLLPTYGHAKGLTNPQSAILVGLIGGASAVGQIIIGWVAHRAGRINMIFACVFTAGAACLVVWMFANSFGLLIVFVLIYGFSSGGFNSIMPALVSDIFTTYHIASVNGIIIACSSIPSLVGAPIAAAILKNNTHAGYQNFTPVILYSGLTILAGCLGTISLKYYASGKLLSKA